MRVQQVAEECLRRGIPTYETPLPTMGLQRLTKAQMQDRIRQQVSETIALGREMIDAGTEALDHPGPGCPSLDPDYADEMFPWETVTSGHAASSSAPSSHVEHC